MELKGEESHSCRFPTQTFSEQ